MTQDWPIRTEYDPTWRSFKGRTAFAPHPFSVETAADLAWPHPYVPVQAPPEAGTDAAPQEPPVFQLTAADEVAAPVAPAPPQPVPPSISAERPAAPLFEPPIPADGRAPATDYEAFRLHTPPKTTPVGKLAGLYANPQPSMPPPPQREVRPWAARPAGIASIAAAAIAIVAAAVIFVVAPGMRSNPAPLKTMFTAPMLVLRAAGPGEVISVPVTIGQPVEPATVLLTLRSTRLSGAGGAAPVEQPILSGVRGVVWSLDAQAGAKLQAGDPLVQLADCGRAFLVMQAAPTTMKAGQTVLIRMPGVRPFHGTVRPSAGVAEPPNTLVIDPTGFNAASPNACPVGVTAEVQPETQF